MKQTKVEQVRQMLVANPKLKAVDVVKALNLADHPQSMQNAYQLIHNAKKKLAKKKLGRPLGAKNKAKPTDTNVLAQLQRENQELSDRLRRYASLEEALVAKEKEVWTLECEVFDKKAVIQYLEQRLGGKL